MGPSTTTTSSGSSTPAGAGAGGGGVGAGGILVSEEYRNLVDKSFSKFSRLKELPPYGRNKWDTYFHKAFQVYSKLWKFQQENREELMRTGLKRWEIGEIASRIGQLYYNYYQRTSDAKFLSESWIFYDAIMTREYFKDTGKDMSLVNKHLRFYARFIVVCLLLNKRDMVRQLVVQFRLLVEEYHPLFQGNDGKEWKSVVQEITRFMKADACCEAGRPLRYSLSLDPHPQDFIPVTSPDVVKPLRLQDAILASYYHNEVKFNELTLDTFRMLQSLEWEPAGMLYRARSSESFCNGTVGPLSGPSAVNKGNLHLQIPDPSLPPNPHKYILYRPTVSSLLLVLATACEELSSDAVLLLYISAAGSFAGKPPRSSQAGSISASSASGSEANLLSPTENVQRSGKHGVDSCQANTALGQNGALPGSSSQLNSRQNSGNHSAVDSHNSGGLWLGAKRSQGGNYLFPSDLLPFTRRPLLIVVDSDNSSAFEVISGHERVESAALLLSPTVQVADDKGPSSASPAHSGGNLFTFFLTAPVPAFCRVVGVSSTSQPLKLQPGILEQLEKIVSELASNFGESLASSPTIDPTWGRIIGDPFLRQMVFRFVLCRATFSLHTLYHNRLEYIPRCLPKLPEEASPTQRIVELGVFQLATNLGVVDQFIFSPSTLSPSRSNGELKWKGKSPAKAKGQVSEIELLGGERTGSIEKTDPTHVEGR
ncbi:unnamed protein product [Calypogeia fissa]